MGPWAFLFPPGEPCGGGRVGGFCPTWPQYNSHAVNSSNSCAFSASSAYLPEPRKCAMCPNKSLRWGPNPALELQPNSENKAERSVRAHYSSAEAKVGKHLFSHVWFTDPPSLWERRIRKIPLRDLRHMFTCSQTLALSASGARRSEQDWSVSAAHTQSNTHKLTHTHTHTHTHTQVRKTHTHQYTHSLSLTPHTHTHTHTQEPRLEQDECLEKKWEENLVCEHGIRSADSDSAICVCVCVCVCAVYSVCVCRRTHSQKETPGLVVRDPAPAREQEPYTVNTDSHRDQANRTSTSIPFIKHLQISI